MCYEEIHDLAVRLDAVVAENDRRMARVKSLRIWRARRRWGGFPSEKNWEALVAAGKDAAEWLSRRDPLSISFRPITNGAESSHLEGTSVFKE